LQDIPHNKTKFPQINHIDNNIHRLITKDTTLYRNSTGLFDGTSKKNIGQIPTLQNELLYSDLKWNVSALSGLDILEFLPSMNTKCGNAHNVVKCVGDIILRSVSTALQSAYSYEYNEDVQNSVTRNDKIYAQRIEGNVSLLVKKIMKYLRNYILSVNMEEPGNEVKESARAGFSWFKPGKSYAEYYTLIRQCKFIGMNFKHESRGTTVMLPLVRKFVKNYRSEYEVHFRKRVGRFFLQGGAHYQHVKRAYF
jgi:hypothetical protein